MAIYFIDGDNSPGARTIGIENLNEDDKVIVFYAQSNSHYGSEFIRNELSSKTKAKVTFVKTIDGKNAVDFAVATRAGFLAAQTGAKTLFLISGDKHFDVIAKIIGDELAENCDIRRVDTLSKAMICDAESINSIEVAENLIKINFGDDEGTAFMNRIRVLLADERKAYVLPRKSFLS